MKNIVIYSRVSTSDQDFQTQIDDLKRWAKLNNYKVIKSFGEEKSGFDLTIERKVYDEMKSFVLKNNVKDIAIWEISRLSRSMKHLLNELDFYTQNKINVHFKKEGIDSLSDNITNKLLLSILGAVGEMERDTIIGRMSRGRMSSILKGKLLNAIPPYGYVKDKNKMWSINEVEAIVIKLIFDMALRGNTLYYIAQHLNSLKIPTRNTIEGKKTTLFSGKEVDAKWRPATVRRYLKKTIYKGIKEYKGNLVSIPAIISPEIYDKVQKRFEDKIGYINKNKHAYLFKGMLRCGKCNRVLSTQTRNFKVGYYLCSGLNDETYPCDNGNYINTDMIDTNLYNSLFTHSYIKEILTLESSGINEKEDKSNQIGYYNNEIEGLEMKQKRIKKLFTEGFYTDTEFYKEMTSLNNTKIDITNKISLLNNEINTLSKVDIDEIIKTYKNANDFNVKREFILKYVNSITLYKIDMANVNWKVPLQKNEKMIYLEMIAFNYNVPLKILMTPYSKNVIISKSLQYLNEYNTIVDTTKKVL